MGAKKKLAARKPASRKPAKKPALLECGLVPVREGYQHLAELELSYNKNNLDGEVPIFARALIGSIAIDADGQHYRMFLRHADLQLHCEGFEAAPQSPRYKRNLDKAEASAHVERVLREETNTAYKGKIAGRFGIKELSISGEAAGGKKREGQEHLKLRANIDLPLVQNLPNFAWRIGDPELGDIRKPNGFLEGDYLNSDCAKNAPLCIVVVRPNAAQLKITGSLSVSLKQGVHVVRDGEYGSSKGIGEEERDGVFAAAFKDRLRALALTRGVDASDRLVIARSQLAGSGNGSGRK